MDSIVGKLKRYTGSADAQLQRINRSTSVGGYTGVDTANRFVQYEQMALMSPHIFVPLNKTCLTLCKNYRFESKNENTEKIKDFEAWAKRINLESKLRTLVRLTCRNGTYIARWNDEDGKSAPEVMQFEPLIMSKTTILPEGFNPDDAQSAEGLILTTPIAKFMVNEGESNEDIIAEYTPEEVVYIALYPYDFIQKDIKDRATYGLYGNSLLESIIDIFNKYMDVIEGFVTYVKKYGQGRYHIDYVVLEEMIKNGQVDEAIEILGLMKEQHALIQANEDIVSTGCKITTLDTGGNSLSVTDFKNSLENDIEVGLFQNPITMGKGEGSTYASGYISESERVLTLEGLQQEFASMINDQIIKPRALQLGSDELTWQDDIQLVFDDISELSVPIPDLIAAYTNDLIDYIQFCKFMDIKPLEKQPENGVNPTKIQVEQAQLNREQQQANMDKQQQFAEKNAKIQNDAMRQQGRQQVPGKSPMQVKTERSQKVVEKKAASKTSK